MMANEKRAVVDKWKKKRIFKLIAPKFLSSVEFGETVAIKPEQIVNRITKVNFGTLTNQVKKRNVDLMLKATRVEGSNIQTELSGFEVKKSYLRRLFRRRTSKIEVVLKIKTKDEKKLKIKYVIVTRGKQELSKKKIIRKESVDYVTNMALEMNLDKFMERALDNNFFSDLMPMIKKMTPISATEVEFTKVL